MWGPVYHELINDPRSLAAAFPLTFHLVLTKTGAGQAEWKYSNGRKEL